jgi:hypothetical protein
MGCGKAFVEVLDELLDGYESDAPAPRPHPHLRVATCSHVWRQQGLAPAASAWTPAREAQTRETSEPRRRRTLSMKQQHALDALLALGARIGADFTDAELRSVFRELALRYHPDRHTSRDEAERRRLALLFARAHEAYELLKTAAPKTLH